MSKVAIVGSGLIGRSWAVLFSRGGYNVVLYDVQQEQLTGALTVIEGQLKSLAETGLLQGKDPAECLSRISTVTSLQQALEGAFFVQECVPEQLELKKKIYGTLDELAAPGTILCSSTSCIVPSKFTEELKNRECCIVAHPVNPPHYCPAVEIIPAPWTSDSVKARTIEVMKEIGMQPVVAKKECDGFILNRLQYAVLMEGWRLVEEGVCGPEDIDTVMTGGLGLRWSFIGPFETANLNAPNGMRDYAERYSAGIVRVSETFGAPRAMEGATLDTVADYLDNKMPLDKLPEVRDWRDENLKKLAVFKQTMSEQPR